jgi:hypothetical protein
LLKSKYLRDKNFDIGLIHARGLSLLGWPYEGQEEFLSMGKFDLGDRSQVRFWEYFVDYAMPFENDPPSTI